MPPDPPDAEVLLSMLTAKQKESERAAMQAAKLVVIDTVRKQDDKQDAAQPPAPLLTVEELDLLIGGTPAEGQINVAMVEEARAATAKVLAQAADGGGLRLNAGKTRIDLIPPEWIWALADVLTVGSIKYAARNWERGMDWSNMIGCTMRHDLKFILGERYDGETGCHHLAMAAWNNLALMSYDIRSQHLGKPVGNNDLPALGVELLNFINSGNPTSPKIREALGLPPL
jgi:hypothetical protein